MPQPLTSIRPGPYTLDFTPGAEKKAPTLLPLAMNVISAASMADAQFARLIAQFTHGRAKPVIDYYLSLRNDAPKLAVIEALAAAALPPARFSLFKAVAKLYETAIKGRQPLAHWLWGHCDEIPDGILLWDPREWLIENGLSDPITVKMRQAYLRGDQLAMLACSSELSALRSSRLHTIMVYRAKDFTNLSRDIWQAETRLNDLHGILSWDAVNPQKGSEEAQLLAQRPELASLIAAQQNAQKELPLDTPKSAPQRDPKITVRQPEPQPKPAGGPEK